jgi:hypothetical protein
MYLFIRIRLGNESEFYAEVKQYPNVVGVDLVHGSYDIVLMVEASASGTH